MGHAAGDESAEGAGEAGDGDLADDGSEDGHLELDLVIDAAAELGAADHHENDDEAGDAAGGDQEVGFNGAGDAEDEAGEWGELRALEHAGEDGLELRDDVNHEDGHDDDGDDHDGDGVEHGGDDLALDFLGLFHELGEAVEDDFENAAELAGLDHVHIEAVENLGMLREALGEGAAALDGRGEVADNVFERGILLLFFEDAEAAQEGKAGVHESGQLTGESGEGFVSDATPEAGDLDLHVHAAAAFFALGAGAGGGFGLLLALFPDLVHLDDFRREETHFLDAGDGFVLAGDFEGALGLLAASVHRYVTEFWHKESRVKCISPLLRW
jgi:hypothetical protein